VSGGEASTENVKDITPPAREAESPQQEPVYPDPMKLVRVLPVLLLALSSTQLGCSFLFV